MTKTKNNSRLRALEKAWAAFNQLQDMVRNRITALDGAPYEQASEEWMNYSQIHEEIIHTQQDHHDKFNAPAVVPDPNLAIVEAQFISKKAMLSTRKNQVENGLVSLRREMEVLPNDAILTRAQYHHFSTMVDSLKEMLQGDILTLQDELLAFKPAEAQNLTITFTTFYDALIKDHQEVTLILAGLRVPNEAFSTSTPASSMLEPPPPANGATGSVQRQRTNLYNYRKEDIPGFESGDVGDYPGFKKEWLESVMQGQSEAWILRNLNSVTPKEDDLSIYSTSKEAWLHLDAKYANPVAVSASLMKEFLMTSKLEGSNDQKKLLDLYHKVMKLHKRLSAEV